MSTPAQLSPVELERLVAELDAGDHDERMAPPASGPTAAAPLQRFADVKPFDVTAWAERKGVKLPQR